MQYEDYLRTVLTENAFYQYSTSGKVLKPEFWSSFFQHVRLRYRIVPIQLLFYSFPFLLIFALSIFKTTSRSLLSFVFLFSFGLAFFLYQDVPLQTSNIFEDMAVGPETFYEVYKYSGIRDTHTHSDLFLHIADVLKLLVLPASVTLLFCALFNQRKLLTIRKILSPAPLFAICIFVLYLTAIMLSESFFDRYHLPLFVIILLSIARFVRWYQPALKWAAIPLLLLSYISICGTHDYFRMNERRWEAYNYLVKEKKTDPVVINGGFEVNCWNNGYPGAWYTYMFVHNMEYIIQFSREDSFSVIKNYPFQRYFPVKKDTVRLMRRSLFPAGIREASERKPG